MKKYRILLLGVFIGIFSYSLSCEANAMGYVAWTPPSSSTLDFSEDISVNSVSPNTAWKAQVRISSDMLFGIAVAEHSPGQFDAEFGTYFNQGVQNIAIPGQTCVSFPASGSQQNFINCSIPISFNVPSKFTLIIRRDPSDSTAQNWIGSIKNPSTGDESIIAKFNVGTANLSIQDILEYIYPFGDECQMVEQTQEAIFWKPTSTSGDYTPGSLTKSTCGKVQFLAPSIASNVDGVGIIINPTSTLTQNYSTSIYELLSPEAWTRAFSKGVSDTQITDNQAYSSLQAIDSATIQGLQSQIANLTSQLTNLQNQLKVGAAKLSKICSIRKKPAGC